MTIPPVRGRLRAAAGSAAALGLDCLFALVPALLQDPPPAPRSRVRLFPPLVTFVLLLHQCLSRHGSGRQALIRYAAVRVARGLPAPSLATGAYCRAKQRLPLSWMWSLAGQLAAAMVRGVGRSWLWCGHDVKVLDGTEIALADTAANQRCYPQTATQKPGAGFPKLHLAALFSLATGAFLDAATGSLQCGERALARQLLERGALAPGDVVVHDRGFGSYAMACALACRHILLVSRIHPRLGASISRIKRLGHDDWLVCWHRPRRADGATSAQEWRQLPDSLRARIITVRIEQPGLRTQSYVLITTLLDPQRYSPAALAELYRRRWQVELDLRHIKTTMGFAMLASKSPAMAERELAAALVAYNFVRLLMARAAHAAHCDPGEISFAAAMTACEQLQAELRHAPARRRPRALKEMIVLVGTARLPKRRRPAQPRAVKKRVRFPSLRVPRSQWKENPHCSRKAAKAKKQRIRDAQKNNAGEQANATTA